MGAPLDGGEHYLNGASVFYLLTNRNSRSIAIDLKAAGGQSGRAAAGRGADVVVQNYRPGVAERPVFWRREVLPFAS